MYKGSLDRFKKAQSLEPFSVSLNSSNSSTPEARANAQPIVKSYPSQNAYQQNSRQPQQPAVSKPTSTEAVVPATQITQVGGGQSTWQPPDWAIEPRSGVYYLEVLKDGEVLDKINLDKRRHIFGRQAVTCDFVLDHQSVSRQHAVVVPHKNGSIYVIDLGSVHGTFVANERLTKDNPVELEVGQSLKFAASTRIYILRKNTAALFPAAKPPSEISLPSPPDPSDEDAVVAYNTILNRYGLSTADVSSKSAKSIASGSSAFDCTLERPRKRTRRLSVAFRDQVGGELVEVVGISDGADVETEAGPIGVKEGSLVGKYESLVQVTVIPKGKEQIPQREDSVSPKGVTEKLQQVLNKVKSVPKSGIFDDLYGDSFSGKVGTSWAYKLDGQRDSSHSTEGKTSTTSSGSYNVNADDDDDLFGD